MHNIIVLPRLDQKYELITPCHLGLKLYYPEDLINMPERN
jgi:hypothetical protein